MRNKCILSCILLVPAFGQTQVDLGNQSKNVDFSKLPMVRPFRSGAALPATCVTGEMFFNTSAVAGTNSYGCTAPNTWVVQGGPPVVLAPTLMQVTLTGATTIGIGSNCSVATPCAVRVGATTYNFISPATLTLNSGSGLTYIYVDSNGAITAGTADASSPALACAGCQILNPIVQFPGDSIPLMTWSATGGIWATSGTDERALLSAGRSFSAGPNTIITESGSNVTISEMAAVPPTGPGTGTPAPDPLDMTQFDRSFIFAEYAYGPGNPWAFLGSNCRGDLPSTGLVAGESLGTGWSSISSPCFLSYPNGSGLPLPFTDFISGANPLNYTLKVRYARGNADGVGTGDHYIGWSSAKDGSVPNFVGFRYLASRNAWQCVIAAGGTDVDSQLISVLPDSSPHTFSVANGPAANSVKCTIDAASATAAGTIPATPWYAVIGSNIASGFSFFTAIEARIQISGILR